MPADSDRDLVADRMCRIVLVELVSTLNPFLINSSFRSPQLYRQTERETSTAFNKTFYEERHKSLYLNWRQRTAHTASVMPRDILGTPTAVEKTATCRDVRVGWNCP